MRFGHVLALWVASFVADNLWRIVYPLTDNLTARASYVLSWAALAILLAFAAAWWRPWAFAIAAAGAVGALIALDAAQTTLYLSWVGGLRVVALAACFGIVTLAIGRWAFAATIGLAGGHALALLSYLVVRISPIALPDAGSQLAMRYGPWASMVEALGCLLIMALAMAWAGKSPRA